MMGQGCRLHPDAQPSQDLGRALFYSNAIFETPSSDITIVIYLRMCNGASLLLHPRKADANEA